MHDSLAQAARPAPVLLQDSYIVLWYTSTVVRSVRAWDLYVVRGIVNWSFKKKKRGNVNRRQAAPSPGCCLSAWMDFIFLFFFTILYQALFFSFFSLRSSFCPNFYRTTTSFYASYTSCGRGESSKVNFGP